VERRKLPQRGPGRMLWLYMDLVGLHFVLERTHHDDNEFGIGIRPIRINFVNV